MHYTREQIDQSGFLSPLAVRKDWLEQDAELTKLREAAAAVVEAWGPRETGGYYSESDIEEAINNLRRAAGIKGPPQDGTDGDRADEAYERKGDR